MTKQPTFNSKPCAVTEWMFLGNRHPTRLPVVSTDLRVLAIK